MQYMIVFEGRANGDMYVGPFASEREAEEWGLANPQFPQFFGWTIVKLWKPFLVNSYATP